MTARPLPGAELCVHCGFCLQACPTYLTLDDEHDSPRGRIVLMKALAAGTDVKVTSFETGINGQNNTLGGTLNVGPGTSLVVQNNFTIGNTAGGGAVSHGIINQIGGPGLRCRTAQTRTVANSNTNGPHAPSRN